MRDVGPQLGDLHWKESTGLGNASNAIGMLEAARTANRLSLRDPCWKGEKGQGRWQAIKLLEWAAKELSLSRREIEMEHGDMQDWFEREKMERRMRDSLLKWLGFDKPP